MTPPQRLTDSTFHAADFYALKSLGLDVRSTRFQATGEYRNPQKGEWYLSGAIIQAYQAPNDFSTPYWIAKPVKLAACEHCKGTGKVVAP